MRFFASRRLQDVPAPVPSAGEVLIRVYTCSVNRGLDLVVRETGMGFAGFSLPHLSGVDPAGELAAVGSGVTGLRADDRVATYPLLRCGECGFCRRGAGENYCRHYRVIGVHLWGGYAEYVKVPAPNVIALSETVSCEAASALSLCYTTAWHGLVTRARIGPYDSVLVLAAGSGVGVTALQIARLHGARVIAAPGSDWKLERARALGATAGITAQVDLRALYRNYHALHGYMVGTSDELRHLIDLVAQGKLGR